jgi:hypothetical protein
MATPSFSRSAVIIESTPVLHILVQEQQRERHDAQPEEDRPADDAAQQSREHEDDEARRERRDADGLDGRGNPPLGQRWKFR